MSLVVYLLHVGCSPPTVGYGTSGALEARGSWLSNLEYTMCQEQHSFTSEDLCAKMMSTVKYILNILSSMYTP